MKETKLQAVVLKKQAFGEADEIVTCFSSELGKVRFLAKSIKLSKSKLQHALQLPFLVEIKLTNGRGSLAKVISATVVESFSALRENPELGSYAFFALESILKFTPDEQVNSELFSALVKYLKNINLSVGAKVCKLELVKFKIAFLSGLGFSVNLPAGKIETYENLGFSNSLGGFTWEKAFDLRQVSQNAVQAYCKLVENPNEIFFGMNEIDELNNILSGFVTYHMEREIKSEKYIML
jgi:DNA repair protein RecO (recombination protein O)